MAKGTLRAEYLHTHVWVWDGKEAQARQWHLLVRRELGARNPAHVLAYMHASRFFIGHTFREAKSELATAGYRCGAGMPGTTTWRWR